MSLITGGGISDNIFKDLAQLQLAEVPNDRRLELITGERYQTGATNEGDGLLLAGGNYANPIESGVSVEIINGDSDIGVGEYIITADSTLTLEDGVLGDTVKVTSLYAVTTVTINATQNFNDGTNLDMQFILSTPNVTFSFINNGTEWEV